LDSPSAGAMADLPGISLAVVGPPGSGKTTALAHICHLLGGFPEEQHAECRSLAKDLGAPADEHGWMLDRLREERLRGCTIEASIAAFKSGEFSFTAIDTPGDPGFVKNMVSVTSLADVAVLVVPATPNFEAEVESGRAREVALACFTMGIKNVCVWVTKMDDISVQHSQSRFEDIKKVVNAFLKEVGYKQKEVPFVPISGIFGDNLVVKSSETSWYAGKPAVEVLDSMGPINRPAEKPLRLPVLKVREDEDVGTIFVGRVETGSVRNGVKVLFSPSGYIGEVRSLRKDGKEVSEGKTGDIVSVCLGDTVSAENLRRGMVASPPTNDPAADAETFLAQVIVLDHPGSIRNGYCPAIAVHTAQVPCEFEELVALIDRKTGKDAQAKPEKVKTGDVVTVRMRPRAHVCVEAFATYPSLGRFAVRDHGRTIAVGVVKEVTKRPIPKVRGQGGNEYFDS